MPKPSFPAHLASTSLTSGIVACWPLNEGSGTVATDIVGGGVLDCSGSGVSWNASPLGLLTVGSPSRAFVATPAYLKLQPGASGVGPGLSMLWVGKVLGTLGNQGGFAGVAETSLHDYILEPFSAAISYGSNASGTGTGAVGTTAPVVGTTYNVLLRIGNPQDGGLSGTPWVTGFVGGVLDTQYSQVSNPTITYGAGSTVFLGTYTGQSAATNLRHDLLTIWNRQLTSAEAAALNSDPWQIFVPPSAASGAALLMAM